MSLRISLRDYACTAVALLGVLSSRSTAVSQQEKEIDVWTATPSDLTFALTQVPPVATVTQVAPTDSALTSTEQGATPLDESFIDYREWRLEKRRQALKDTKFELNLRSFYFDRSDFNRSENRAWAIGGWLGVKTGYFLDHVAFGAIVNVTPDSFSDGGSYASVDDAVKHASQMIADGADLLDVGGESTRPGSEVVPADEEIQRVGPVIRRIAEDHPDVPVSVDTRKSDVARAALEAGATIVNDVSAGSDPDMFGVVAGSGAGMILMHMKGEPKTMQDDPTYYDVVARGPRIPRRAASRPPCRRGSTSTGSASTRGSGSARRVEHNLAILRDIRAFHHLRVPVLVGPSRKRFIGTLTGTEVDDRIGERPASWRGARPRRSTSSACTT